MGGGGRGGKGPQMSRGKKLLQNVISAVTTHMKPDDSRAPGFDSSRGEITVHSVL
jgi:hypothetical protein